MAERQGEMEKLAAGIQVVERPEARNMPEQREKAAEKKGADKKAETGKGALC